MAYGETLMEFLSQMEQAMSISAGEFSRGQVAATLSALDEPLAATLTRWQSEAAALERAGIYDWLAGRVQGARVLEIGCGFGHSTASLVQTGKTVFALDNRMDCLEAARERTANATYGMADIQYYDERLLNDLRDFAPEAVVCWLAGAPADALPRDVPAAYAVMQHRLVLQQATVRLAGLLETARTIHLADRTAFPWKMKEAGRQTMTRLITTAVIQDAPFTLAETDVHYRKIGNSALPKSAGGTLQGVVPVVGEATLKRRHNHA